MFWNDINSCPECRRLWEEYTRATVEQLRLLDQLPTHSEDWKEIQKREAEIDAAGALREQTWHTMREHHEKVHRHE